MNHRIFVFLLWLAVLTTALFVYVFHREALQQLFLELSASPPVWVYVVYLALGCVRDSRSCPRRIGRRVGGALK